MTKNKNPKKHHGREDLAGEHRLSDIGQIICLISFLTIWILDSFIFQYSNFLSQFIPWWILILIAIPIWVIAGYLAFDGLKTVFGEKQEKPTVISTGVFKYLRHPIYLGSMLVYVGWIISTLSLLSIVLFVIIALFYNCIANYEEKLLLEKFGEEYQKYMHSVPKWGIRLKKQK
jgi:protein-S-isoprenylcysteine O-methyltransferase Ste14